ncbi:COX15/CtaA family protein [Haloechinothrix salitolerans]|uniref:Heme A synthase n=1 Tax=Haloechinothrix salitolerans TaxID=926830 RepID=A0ABW2C1R6_9PSEU
MRFARVRSWTNSLIARLPRPSAATQQALGLAAVATQAGIGVTGSVVRVTGSGLGCSTWPQCHDGSMFPVEHTEYETLNQWIEFGNRLLTGVVGVVAIACVLAAWRLHLESRGRPRLVKYALAVLGGTGFQGVLGGITVRMELLWWTVALHFLASAVLVWIAVMLLHAFREGESAPRWLVPDIGRRLLVALVAALAVVLTAGTFVTGAGPHGGDPETPRLDVSIALLTKIHGGALVVFLSVLVLLGLTSLHAAGSRRFTRRYALLWAAALAQGALGSVQYELGVPESLVSLHVLGSALVVITTAALWCSARDRGAPPPSTLAASSPEAAAAPTRS